MSLFAVQYRDMHTAVHNLAIFLRKAEAQDLLEYLQGTESWPPDQPDGLHANIEINYRNPPTEYKGTSIEIINPERNNQPDVY